PKYTPQSTGDNDALTGWEETTTEQSIVNAATSVARMVECSQPRRCRGPADDTARCEQRRHCMGTPETGSAFEAVLRAWDGEELILRRDQTTGAWIMIAVHSTRLGPAGGGTRMKSYPDLAAAVRDAQRLAEGMTKKFAVAGLPRGGGKAVIAVPPDLAVE